MKKNRQMNFLMFASLLILTFTLLTVAGCQAVHVRDADGKAVSYAQVSSGVQGSKFSSMPAMTDALGNALLPMGMTESKSQWVAVSKEGYLPRRIPRPANGKIVITLQKANSSRGRFMKKASPMDGGKLPTKPLPKNQNKTSSGVVVPRK